MGRPNFSPGKEWAGPFFPRGKKLTGGKFRPVTPCHRDGSFEYPQHMFWLRNKKNNFQLRTLICGPETFTFLQGSNRKICVNFKDFSRTFQGSSRAFMDYKFMKNTDLHVYFLHLIC